MSIINKICLYSYDIIREEFKSNSFKNIKEVKKNDKNQTFKRRKILLQRWLFY